VGRAPFLPRQPREQGGHALLAGGLLGGRAQQQLRGGRALQGEQARQLELGAGLLQWTQFLDLQLGVGKGQREQGRLHRSGQGARNPELVVAPQGQQRRQLRRRLGKVVPVVAAHAQRQP